GEANQLLQMIGRFQVGGVQAARAAPTRRATAPPTASRPLARPAVAPASAASRPGVNPVRAAQAKLAAFTGSAQPAGDEWEEF
ncbi:methyl-accepting chemotaxis protein, partial [Caulobacter sp. LARHSG274]